MLYPMNEFGFVIKENQFYFFSKRLIQINYLIFECQIMLNFLFHESLSRIQGSSEIWSFTKFKNRQNRL